MALNNMLDDDVPTCSECGCECTPKLVDFGIGPGEAWGVPFNDVHKEWVSACCEADMTGFDESMVQTEPDPDEAYDLERDERGGRS